jgi:hypothetical protein
MAKPAQSHAPRRQGGHGHEGEAVQAAVHDHDPGGLAGLVSLVQDRRQGKRHAEAAGPERVRGHRALRRQEHDDVRADRPSMAGQDRAYTFLIRARRRRSERYVARERPRGRDQVTAARLELGHEQSTGQPQLLVDRVARAGGGRDSEEAPRHDDNEQAGDNRDEPTPNSTDRPPHGRGFWQPND